MSATMKKMADEQLVELFSNGNDAAFAELDRRYREPMLRAAIRKVNDADLAEDVLQDSWIKVCQTIKDHKYENRGKFGAFMSTVVNNKALDEIDKRTRKTKYVSDCEINDDLAGDNGADELEEKLEREEKLDKILNAVNNLPENQRRVVELRLQEVKFKEIAEIVGCPQNTALSRYRDARKNIEKELGLQ